MGRKEKKVRRLPLGAREAAELADEVVAQERSERAWREMTSPEPSSAEDVWNAVEDHLIAKPHESHHRDRRWKYFGK